MTCELSPNYDFYQYVNNEWLNNPLNQIPGDYSSWGGFTKLHDDGLKNQIEIVKNLENRCDTPEKEKIYAIWNASEKRFKGWDKGTSNCEPIISEIKILDTHFSNFFDYSSFNIKDNDSYIKYLAKYLYYTQINGISNVIDFDSGSDLKNVNNVVLDFSTTGLSLPSREYYKSSNFSDKLQLYEKHLENVKEILKNYIKLGPNFVKNILDFEQSIAEFSMKPEQSREYDKYYTNSNLEDLYKNINELNSLPSKQENYEEENRNIKLNENELKKVEELFEELYKHFDFKNILEKNYEKNFNGNKNPPNKYHITAYDGDAIIRCMKLILNTDNFDKYRSYMQYKIIKSFKGFCIKELDDEFFDFYARKLGGQQEQNTNDKRSINIVNSYAGEMMGKLFVSYYFPEESKKEMEKLVKNILNIMNNSLNTNDWLTEDTKSKAVSKLTTFRSKIGYPNIWKEYSDFDIKIGDSLYDISKKAKKWSLRVNFFEKLNSVLDREEWRMTPQTVNAYFMPTQNEIVFPAAILQPPFFHQSKETIDFNIEDEINMVNDLDVITPTNYGGIGAVIAHEITHGYDDKGRKFDEEGNLNDWWNEQDVNLFQKKTEIMVDSVEKYLYIDKENNKEYKMNPQLTMGENLADIGGLSLSMKALLKKLFEDNADELRIKTSLRVFFKAWANIWKQNIKKDKRIMLLNVDPHAPTDFRGNLVQHMDEFYNVFNIKEGDKMFLDKSSRMKMW